MSKLTRVIQRVFGETGTTNEFGQFGSEAASPPGTTTKDLTVIQSLSQYLLGWYSATANASEPPRIQDRNALDLLFSSQLKYLFQNGIPEWLDDADQRYYTDISFVTKGGIIYVAIQGDDASNINAQKDPLTETAWWTPILKALEDAEVLNTAHRTSDGTDHFNILNSLKGMNHVVLTEYTTTTVPAIEANSQVEINGSIYTNPLEIVISGATSNSTWYDILLTPSGTTFTASFVARGTGAWSDSKQGLYSGNNRVIATVYRDASANFINKNILSVINRNVEIKVEIGPWNMDTTNLVTVIHGLTIAQIIDTKVTLIRNDGGSLKFAFGFWISGQTSNDQIKYDTGVPTIVTLIRGASGLFDDPGFASTAFSRGDMFIKYGV